MNKTDFRLLRNEKDGEHDDYWFEVTGESRKELEDTYMEMCMVGIDEVVYSKDEDLVGVKRIFPFNFDVIIHKDTGLNLILNELI